jgi:Cdc6-like AAA superfamily ATPase
MPLLEQVFKKSGIPDITFVEPKEFPKVSVALRTPGRGIVVEGPSGIGKTTCLHRAIEKEGLNAHCLLLSGRKKSDIELIESLPELVPFQIVIVDDFHKLDQHIQNMLADLLKVLADEERQDSKLVLVGINRAGQNLIDYAPDLLNRVEVIRLGKANDEIQRFSLW